MQSVLDVSVVMPFGDDEDLIGAAVRKVAAHLREHEVSFELLAVDEHSGDNSHAVLALLRPEVDELRICNAPGRGRGLTVGVHRARGRVLWLITPRAASAALSPFGRAYRRVLRHEVDVVEVARRCVVGNRIRVLPLVDGMRGNPLAFQRRLARRATARGLQVDTQVLGGTPPEPRFVRAGLPGLQRPIARLLGALPGLNR